MSLGDLLRNLERRQQDAARMHATAPVAEVLGAVLEDLRPLVVNGDGAREVPVEPDHLLTAEVVAGRLTTSLRWVYDHADQLGGRRLSRRCLRFPESAIRRYLDRRR